MVFFFLSILNNPAAAVSAVINFWWFWLPPLLFYGTWELWKEYLKIRYFKNLEWVLLEIKIPREIAKPPQAMEQVFAGLHAIRRPFDPDEKYWYGLQVDYLTLEIVSHGGVLHFFINTPKHFRSMVEAQIYAQYPESEIREADDPARYLPEKIPSNEWTLFAAEFKLAKEDPYPIRTYSDFVLKEGSKEEIKVDPVSAIVESISKIGPDEHIGIQLIIRPADDDWKEVGQKIIKKLIGRKDAAKESAVAKVAREVTEAFMGSGEEKKKDEPSPFESAVLYMTSGEADIVKGIERKTAKLGFETVFRFVHVARCEVFDMVHFSSFMGAIRQFNTLNLNSLKLNSRALVGTKWYSLMKSSTKDHKRRAFYYYYRKRYTMSNIAIMDSKPVILNIEELATIFHFPGLTAAAPMMPRLQARRAEPPAGLPVG